MFYVFLFGERHTTKIYFFLSNLSIDRVIFLGQQFGAVESSDDHFDKVLFKFLVRLTKRAVLRISQLWFIYL